MTTDPENLPSLDDASLDALIQHYLSLKHKMPDNECLSPEGSKHDKSGAINLRVRERLVELQDEQLKRQIEALGNYEPIGDDIKNQLNNQWMN